MLCMLPRLGCYYSVRAWTLNMGDKSPEKQVAHSSFPNKWHPQSCGTEADRASTIPHVYLYITQLGQRCLLQWSTDCMKLRKLMAFPVMGKKERKKRERRQTADWSSWNTTGTKGKSKWSGGKIGSELWKHPLKWIRTIEESAWLGEWGANRSPHRHCGLSEPLICYTIEFGKWEKKHFALAAACLIFWSECTLEKNFNYRGPSEQTFILKQDRERDCILSPKA